MNTTAGIGLQMLRAATHSPTKTEAEISLGHACPRITPSASDQHVALSDWLAQALSLSINHVYIPSQKSCIALQFLSLEQFFYYHRSNSEESQSLDSTSDQAQ